MQAFLLVAASYLPSGKPLCRLDSTARLGTPRGARNGVGYPVALGFQSDGEERGTDGPIRYLRAGRGRDRWETAASVSAWRADSRGPEPRSRWSDATGRKSREAASSLGERAVRHRGGRDPGGATSRRWSRRWRNGRAASTSSSTTRGTNIRKRPEDLDESEWRTVLDTNLTSAFLCSRACHPHMRAAGGGKILNNGSMMSIFGAPWSPALRGEQGRHGPAHQGPRHRVGRRTASRVNCFLPGWIDTDLTRRGRDRRCRS